MCSSRPFVNSGKYVCVRYHLQKRPLWQNVWSLFHNIIVKLHEHTFMGSNRQRVWSFFILSNCLAYRSNLRYIYIRAITNRPILLYQKIFRTGRYIELVFFFLLFKGVSFFPTRFQKIQTNRMSPKLL